MYRHGDVLVVAASELPEGAELVKPDPRGIVLAEGEATGHAHTMPAATTKAYELDGIMWIVVDEPTPLSHQEHDTLVIAPGVWRVKHQREYTPEGIRNVLD